MRALSTSPPEHEKDRGPSRGQQSTPLSDVALPAISWARSEVR